ncbi:hypothetical protein PWY87_16710 [Kribbella solani]|nr:hypothetical protein [Kribbella solani]MDX3003331.1 hypothetical protein [Kribbella solani]
MEAGRIAARGTHQELLAVSELYRSLVQALRINTETELETAEPEPDVERVGGL